MYLLPLSVGILFLEQGVCLLDEKLRQLYADFIVKVGVNVQPRQTFIIRCPVTMHRFAYECANAGYDAGAKRVIVRWEDETLSRLSLMREDEKTLTDYKDWQLRMYLDYAQEPDGVCTLAIDAQDPEAYAGLDGEKISRVSAAGSRFMKPWQDYMMNDRIQWCVASVPTQSWASKVFPDVSVSDAVEKLWQVIFDVCRVTGGNPVAEWKDHIAKTTSYCNQLNEWNLDRVHFKSRNGTDLTVGLADDAKWEGGSAVAENGVGFIANVPTEEVFTAPHRERVEGIVFGSKPFVFQGQVIDGWHVTFHNGKVVEHGAEKNGSLFAELLHSDENADRIGELALVPVSSPINQSGILFRNTLFDENAACHIAFGAGYSFNIRGGNSLSREQLLQKGLNDSVVHEDVMIGAADTLITGYTKEGTEVTIFQNGDWAF